MCISWVVADGLNRNLSFENVGMPVKKPSFQLLV